MTSYRKLQLQAAAVSVLLCLLLSGLSLSTSGYRIETLALDSWFSLRYRLFGAREVDPSLMLVGIDEHTIQHFGKPRILWDAELAQLVTAIKSGQPAAVGIDILTSPALKGLDDEDPLKMRIGDGALQLGMTALEPPPVIFIEVRSDGYFSEDADSEAFVITPHEVIVDLIQQPDGKIPQLAIANAAVDKDGSVRRAKLYFRPDGPDGSDIPVTIPIRLLEAASGEKVEFRRDSEGRPLLSWKGREVPFLDWDSFLINYPGPTEDNTLEPHSPDKALTFPIVSGQAVLKGEVKPDTFKDKIVIVAPTASSLFDEKTVPGDTQYHGAATHLSVINMFLTDSFVSRPKALWVLFILGAGMAGLAVGRRGQIVPGIAATAGVPLLAFFSFGFANLWLPTVFPLAALFSSGLFGYLVRLLTVERDRKRVRSTFARMVSPQVMNHVLTNYQALRTGERKEVTVLFSDINDFTPTCEQHTPEEVIQMLSEYFSMMVDVIMKYNGYLKQYVGDEIMVIYGAPEDSDDHATRAVLTALEMRDALRRAKETSNGKPGFYEVKIGINTGSVVVGKVGPESRWEYAAVGDDVNLGARVLSVAKKLGMDIGVSAASKKRFESEMEHGVAFSDKVEWQSKGIQSFKGKISQMEVFGIKRGESCEEAP